MEVIVMPSYIKDLRKAPNHILKSSDLILHKLRDAKSLEQSGVDFKKCKAGKGKNYYRIRLGDWRIGIELKHPTVIVITILARGRIYKKFPPK